jgi:hypothetical protein
MATIAISDLSITGLDLFSDSESYMNELSDGDMVGIKGGGTPVITLTIAYTVAVSFAVSYVNRR